MDVTLSFPFTGGSHRAALAARERVGYLPRMRITDQDRLTWGPALSQRLAPVSDLHAIVAERGARQAELSSALAEAEKRIDREASEEGAALDRLTQASEDAERILRLVALKLETAHLEGEVADDAFRAFMGAAFPHGAGATGSTPGDRYQAIKRVSDALAANAELGTRESLAEKAAESVKALESANEEAKREAGEKRAASEALSEARAKWDDAWIATKEILSGLLRDAGRRDELPSYFPDGAAK